MQVPFRKALAQSFARHCRSSKPISKKGPTSELPGGHLPPCPLSVTPLPVVVAQLDKRLQTKPFCVGAV